MQDKSSNSVPLNTTPEEYAKSYLLAAIFSHDDAVISGDADELEIADSFMESRRIVLESVRRTAVQS